MKNIIVGFALVGALSLQTTPSISSENKDAIDSMYVPASWNRPVNKTNLPDLKLNNNNSLSGFDGATYRKKDQVQQDETPKKSLDNCYGKVIGKDLHISACDGCGGHKDLQEDIGIAWVSKYTSQASAEKMTKIIKDYFAKNGSDATEEFKQYIWSSLKDIATELRKEKIYKKSSPQTTYASCTALANEDGTYTLVTINFGDCYIGYFNPFSLSWTTLCSGRKVPLGMFPQDMGGDKYYELIDIQVTTIPAGCFLIAASDGVSDEFPTKQKVVSIEDKYPTTNFNDNVLQWSLLETFGYEQKKLQEKLIYGKNPAVSFSDSLRKMVIKATNERKTKATSEITIMGDDASAVIAHLPNNLIINKDQKNDNYNHPEGGGKQDCCIIF